jgi:hypothetical protein
MRKFLLSMLFFMGISGAAHTQIEAGTMMAGGSAYFNHYRNSDLDVKSNSLMISPQFGLAFADNFVAGAWFSFSSFSEVSSWSVAPFLRYYAKNAFVQLQYGYSRTGDIGQSVFGADLGYAMFLNDNVSLEPALYYNQYFNDGLAGADLGIKIGFQIYFNR